MQLELSIFEAFMMVTIVVGGGFTLYKLGVFRDLKPHLTIGQTVNHRSVGDDYVHISVQVTLTNSSKVAVEINEVSYSLQLISPLPKEFAETLYTEYFENQDVPDIQWPHLDEIAEQLMPSEQVIEPNGRHLDTYEFLVWNNVEAVLLSAYYANSRYKPGDRASKGWEVATVYDVETTPGRNPQ